MSRKKIKPDADFYEPLTYDTKLTVQKSLPLLELWKSDLTLAEFKILDIYLSKIDSHNPENRAVLFTKGELERLLGLTELKRGDLELRLKHLLGNVLSVPDLQDARHIKLIALFETAEARQSEDGLWTVRLECTQSAMRYFFNVEHLGYLRYKLRSITALASRYAYILFLYLEANRFRQSWIIGLEDLKVLLNCSKEVAYTQYKRFNGDLLKRVQKEIHTKTSCRYTYEPVRSGHTVVAVKFTLENMIDGTVQGNIDTRLPKYDKKGNA